MTLPPHPETTVARSPLRNHRRETTFDEREERIARNEALFREVNERIAESAERFDSERAEFVCECADQDCTERVEATLVEYERVRADGAQFLLRPEHVDKSVERVVERRGRQLAIVEKVNAAIARAVRRRDPRTEPA